MPPIPLFTIYDLRLTPLLGDASPASSELGTWIICAAVIAQLALTVVMLTTINSKQKREISFEQEFASKDQFDKHVSQNTHDHENIFSKLGGVERGVEERLTRKLDKLASDDKESRANMHREVTNLTKAVAGLEAGAELMNQRIVQVDGKLDRLIEKENS